MSSSYRDGTRRGTTCCTLASCTHWIGARLRCITGTYHADMQLGLPACKSLRLAKVAMQSLKRLT